MNRNKILSIVLSVFFLNVAALKAQNIPKEKQSLILVLNSLSETYNISFSYIDATVKNKTVTRPHKDLSLEDLLAFLKHETQLDFELLDNRFVIIKAKKKKRRNDFRVQNLEEVVVNNYLTTGITKLNDGSLTIKPKTFGILPGLIEPDVLQTIQSIPGVQSTDETVSNINVRGGTHDQNLILWDGIKMYQSGHFFGLISMYNPQITQSVSLVKNGSDVSYTDGVSGTIAMQTEQEVNDKLKTILSFNLTDLNAFIDIPLGEK